jgi:uncharacterized membrane protein
MRQPQVLLAIAVVAARSWGCAQDAAGPKGLGAFSPARAGLPASATGPTFTAIDFPGGFVTLAGDINKASQIVGRYTDIAGVVHGFLLNSRGFASITVPPGAVWTRAIGINDGGTIVGDYSLTDPRGNKDVHGFLLQSGNYLSFDFPGAAGTIAQGINANGDIVGFYTDNVGNNTGTGANNRHGFLLHNGAFTAIDFPGAGSTEAWRINNNGEVVGRYLSPTDSKWHLYRLNSGSFTAIPDFPGATQTAPGGYSHLGGLNSQGDITSDYCGSTPCQNLPSNDVVDAGVHGFLLSAGIYTTIDPPGAMGSLALGINDYGDIVGAYIDVNEAIHGYLRTP